MVQHGTWQRSMMRFHDIVAFVRTGGLGRLERIECPMGPNNRHVGATWKPEAVPEGLDWEMWLGPAPWRPYHSAGCHYNFRFIADNASGQITNLGAHCLDIGYARMSASDPNLLREMQTPSQRLQLPASNNHYENFFDAVRSRQGTIADAETAHRTTTVCNIGTIALALGRKLRWDPVKEEFVGDDQANRLRRRAMRSPWSLA